MTMGKKLRKCLVMLLCACTLLAMTGISAFAEDAYTYTVKISAGNQGTIADGVVDSLNANEYGWTASVDGSNTVLVIQGLHKGDQVNVDPQNLVTLSNDKYYIKGIQLAGHESETYNSTKESITVDANESYVLAYGLKGDQVAYTVTYVDEDGNAISGTETKTYYGNVGDKPVVAYLYVEGYTPQAYNLTKTLSADASQNVFTFVYTEKQTETQQNTVNNNTSTSTNTNRNTSSTTTTPSRNTTTTTTPSSTDSNAAASVVDGTDAGTVDEDGDLVDLGEDTETPEGATSDLVDLDDDPVAQSSGDTDDTEDDAENDTKDDTAQKSKFKGMLASILIAAAAAAIVFVIFVIRRKKSGDTKTE